MERVEKLNIPTKIAVIILFLSLIGALIFIGFCAVNDSFSMQKIDGYLTGETENEISVEEEIPFGKKTIEDGNIAEGVEEKRQEGKNGKKRIVFRVTKDKDGKEINREVAREEVISEPVDEIIAVGTKKAQPTVPSKSDSGSNKTPSSGGGNNGNNGNSQPSSPQNGSNENWKKYNADEIISNCESKVKAKYGYGFYHKPDWPYMGDSGAYKVVGFIPTANGKYKEVGCSFPSKDIGESVYYDSNYTNVWEASSNVFSKEEVDEIIKKFYH